MDGRIQPIDSVFVRPVEENHEPRDEARRAFTLPADGDDAGDDQDQDRAQGAVKQDEPHTVAHREDVPVSPPPAGSAGSQLDLLA